MGVIFDQEIFRSDFPMAGAHLVAASAGTGKTYNIQNVYARLVMENDFRVSQIQVMTFTEAATKELRDRLRAILKDLQARLHEPCEDCGGGTAKPEDARRRNERADRLIACAPVRRLARDRVEMALLDFDQAAISTIHGFCRRVLTRFAFETGVSLAMEIEDHKTADLEALVRDWWRHRPEETAGFGWSQLLDYVKELGRKTDFVVDVPEEKGKAYLLARAEEIVRQYDAARATRDTLCFDDLLRALRDALRGEHGQELVASLREEFKAALIDEFQDTDPVQYEIFEKVFLDAPEMPVFFVGDPKQAIYSFRSGDIFTYLRACARPGLAKYSLTTNFRSTARLMQAVNLLFQDGPDSAGRWQSTFENEAIGYAEPVQVVKDPETNGAPLDKPFRVIRVPVPAEPGGKPRTVASKGKAVMPMILQLTVEQILAVLAERDENGRRIFAPKDIAVLLATHSSEKDLHGKLMLSGVPSIIAAPGNVFASPTAMELRVFLLGVRTPTDTRALRAALATVYGGMSAEELATLDDPLVLSQKIAWFNELGRQWQQRGLAPLVSALEEGGYRRRLAARADGERLLADSGQILELSLSAVRKLGLSPEKYLEWLTTRIRRAGDRGEECNAEEFARELEREGDAVRIMTIHASKGLQFPIVFLPDCWRVNSRSMSLNVFHDPANDNRLTFSMTPDESSSSTSPAGMLSANETRQEKIRLLYVAMTRAVQRTILLAPPDDAINSKSEPLPGLLERARSRENPDDSPFAWLEASPSGLSEPYVPEVRQSDWRPHCAPRLFDPAPVHGSYSSLSHSLSGGEDNGQDRESGDGGDLPTGGGHPVFAIKGGAAIGNCWHNILEKVPFDADEAAVAAIARGELEEYGFQEECLAPTVDMVRKVLDYSLLSPDGETFRLADIGWNDRLSEQEFDFCSAGAGRTGELNAVIRRHWAADADKQEFLQTMKNWDSEIPKGFLNGFIDLCFRRDGRYYVVDWKSNIITGRREGFDAEGIRREMAAHGYFLQYLLYSAVLHRHLRQVLGDGYDWERHFGGVRYVFLRGVAAGGSAPVFVDRPPAGLLEELGRALGLEA